MRTQTVTTIQSGDGPRVQPAAETSRVHVVVGGDGADIGGMHSHAIQAALDYVSNLGGGTVELTAGRFLVEDSVYLRTNVVLRGQGEATVLVKSNAVRTSLRHDADIHETSATVEDPTGFEVGMGVTIGDNHEAVRERASIRTIVWKSGATLGFDRHFEATQMVSRGYEAYAQTTFPVVYGLRVENAGVENLVVDGNRSRNPMASGWINAGIHLEEVRGGRVSGCHVFNVNCDGICLSTSDDIVIERCVVHDNAELGVHVGTGSQRASVRDCKIYSNGMGETKSQDGLFLCFSAQHGVYERNEIYGNRRAGISIGHKDSDNRFMDNVVHHNRHGVLYRPDTYMAHDNVFRNCLLEDNGDEKEGHGFYLVGDAHGTMIEGCTIRDTRPLDEKLQRVGLLVGAGVKDLRVEGCTIEGNRDEDVRRDAS